MNYKKIYQGLVERATSRPEPTFFEKHHVIPKCLGGTDNDENLVKLTPEEHYVAHQLLVKIHPDNDSLVYAAQMMVPNRPNNKMYGWVRKKFIESCKKRNGEKNSQYGTVWITNGKTNRKISKEGLIPSGWKAGRVFCKPFKRGIGKRKLLRNITAEKKLERLEKLKVLHDVYISGGFLEVKNKGYPYSQQNLVSQFAKYIPEFKPQNGKRRV